HLARLLSQTGNVLVREQLAEAFPGHTRCFGVAAGVQVGFQVNPLVLGFLRVGRLGTLALALAGVRVDPLQHESVAVLEPLHPNRDTFLWHQYLRTMPRMDKKRPVCSVAGNRPFAITSRWAVRCSASISPHGSASPPQRPGNQSGSKQVRGSDGK